MGSIFDPVKAHGDHGFTRTFDMRIITWKSSDSKSYGNDKDYEQAQG
jgi:hypothetical protein